MGGVWYQGGYTGWVYRVGNTGCTTQPPARGGKPARQTATAGSGPTLQGWVVWKQGGLDGRTSARPAPRYHPAGPVRPPEALPVPGTLPTGKGRDLTSIPIKLVKTTKCHQKVFKRPTLVPISQNGVQKSPLDFLRFTISLAFSHKELMGLIWPWVILYCQNDEVTTVCTYAKGSSIPPDVTAASCSW